MNFPQLLSQLIFDDIQKLVKQHKYNCYAKCSDSIRTI